MGKSISSLSRDLIGWIEHELCIPEEKRQKVLYLLRKIIDKKKATVQEIQALCGYLNFLNKAIYPGRAFLRRMYTKYSQFCDSKPHNQSKGLKPYHHICIDSEFKSDCNIWMKFLSDDQLQKVVNRPMLDLNFCVDALDI